MIEGVDFSAARPDPAGLAAAGKAFAVRYVAAYTNKFNLTLDESQQLASHGIWSVAVFERAANRALSGWQAGRDDAATADKAAQACGMPASRPIYFAVDFNPTSGQIPALSAYFQGLIDVLGVHRAGVYGGLGTIRAAATVGITWLWQTYAWSGGAWDPRCQLQQYKNAQPVAGGSVDLTRATVADYGQWMPNRLPNMSPLTQEPEVYRLVGTVDTERQYLVSGSKIILLNADTLDAFTAMGVIQNPGKPDDALQVQVDRAAAAIRSAVA